jgi:hypothetical protein
MFEKLADGFLGLFLFLSQWLSPGATQDEIRIAAVQEAAGGYVIFCSIDLDWNDQMTDLVDAGIPLRFRMRSWSDRGDTAVFIRTLHCDISDYSYAFTDSIMAPSGPRVELSKRHGQILIALKEYTRWDVALSRRARACHIEAELLPSTAARLNRVVDMSNICGCRRFEREFVRKDEPGPERKRGR